MQSVTILAVGKLKERAYDALCAEYIRRLTPFCAVTMTELPEARLPADPSAAQIAAALADEAARLRRAIPQGAYTVALCVEGKQLSSPAFAETLQRAQAARMAFVIGGSNGLDEAFKREADLRLSFSAMTFPHHLFRVMLLEQLYRVQMITAGRAYHK